MTSHHRITVDPEICGGKPIVAGTRILISIILEYIEEGYSFDEIIDNYPNLSINDIKAIVKYARKVVEGEKIVYFRKNEIPA